jgi:hypothetical protein
MEGLERITPLRLSNVDIGKLLVEAEVCDTNLGQLLSRIVTTAMATGLSQVLDNDSSGEAAGSQCDGLRKGDATGFKFPPDR